MFPSCLRERVNGYEAFYMDPLNPQFDVVTSSSRIENPYVTDPETHEAKEKQEDVLDSKATEGFEL